MLLGLPGPMKGISSFIQGAMTTSTAQVKQGMVKAHLSIHVGVTSM
jgi:hypothetical protein